MKAQWVRENLGEILTFVVEGTIIVTVCIISGKRKAKALVWVGGCKFLELVIVKYFRKFNMGKEKKES